MENKKWSKKKKKREAGIRKCEAYSIIINLIFATFAFAFMLGMSAELVSGAEFDPKSYTQCRSLKGDITYVIGVGFRCIKDIDGKLTGTDISNSISCADCKKYGVVDDVNECNIPESIIDMKISDSPCKVGEEKQTETTTYPSSCEKNNLNSCISSCKPSSCLPAQKWNERYGWDMLKKGTDKCNMCVKKCLSDKCSDQKSSEQKDTKSKKKDVRKKDNKGNQDVFNTDAFFTTTKVKDLIECKTACDEGKKKCYEAAGVPASQIPGKKEEKEESEKKVTGSAIVETTPIDSEKIYNVVEEGYKLPKKETVADKKRKCDKDYDDCKKDCINRFARKAVKKELEKRLTDKKKKENKDTDFWSNLGMGLLEASMIGVISGAAGKMLKGKHGFQYGFISGFIGSSTQQLLKKYTGLTSGQAGALGIATGLIFYISTYKREYKETIQFNCKSWEAPIKGDYCELCNKFSECSDYACKSLGQACEIVNKGTEDQKCIWKNPGDILSPKIFMGEVLRGFKYQPDPSMRPTGTGIEVTKCIEAFTPLQFNFNTDEPAQCKIDYNLTTQYDSMMFYVGKSSLYLYNHTETLSLPGPESIEQESPEVINDGTHTLYVRCQDANGNYNKDAYSVRFCVEPGEDSTAPTIVESNIPSGSPIQFNQTSLQVEFYINEPAECRWNFIDRSYGNMDEDKQMDCSKADSLHDANERNLYTCVALLTGIKDRQENNYYVKCKDQPKGVAEDKRNTNKQSFLYKIIGTQPLNILEVSPVGETIVGSADTVAVDLEIKTDNGYDAGKAICYFSEIEDEESYIPFLETGYDKSLHKQRLDLVEGDYIYYLKCADLGGNADYATTNFTVKTDRTGPTVIRAYKESGELKIMTLESAQCSYSFVSCNFEIDDGVALDTIGEELKIHTAEWKVNKNYYIRCRDKYNNQPNPNTCSIIVNPFELVSGVSDYIEL